jgi:hypothetical protein
MTIETTSNQARFIGNGATTVFPFGFLIPSQADLLVYFTSAAGVTSLLPNTAYTVSGLGNVNGGSVTYNPGAPIPANSILLIQRRLPYTQDVDLVNQDGFYPEVVEDGLDSLEMQIQQLVQDQSLNLMVGVTDTSPGQLPAAAARANKFLAFDSSGNAIAANTATGVAVSSAMQPVVSAASLAAARTAMGLGLLSTFGIGAGLRNDGSGNVAVNSPITNINSATAIGLAQDLFHYAVTGACTGTAAKANTLFNGFCFWVEAAAADFTFAIDPSDTISGSIGSGVSWTVPQGQAAFIKTDGVSTWYVEMFGEPVAKTISGNYNVTAADNGKVLSHTSGAFGTIVFPAGSTLPAKFRCWISGDNAGGRGKGVSGLNVGSFTLYPTQGYMVKNVGGTLVLVGGIRPYKVSSIQLYCHSTLGSDNVMVADGLADGAGAKLTQNASRQQLYSDFNHNGSQPKVSLTGLFNESVTFGGQPVNCGVFFWVGTSASNYEIRPTGSGSPFCFIVGDGATLEFQNIIINGNGLTGSVGIQLHQTAIVDLLSGISFGNFSSTGSHVATDGAGWTLNYDASYTISNGGNAANHILAVGTGTVNITGGITITINGGPPAVMTTWIRALGNVLINCGSGITVANSLTAGCQKWNIGPGAVLSLSGNAAVIPGSVAGAPVTGAAPAAGAGWAIA